MDDPVRHEALLPCPHCGAAAFRHENDWCEPSLYRTTCSKCFAGTTGFDAQWKADKAWNRRASTDELVNALEEILHGSSAYSAAAIASAALSNHRRAGEK